MVEAGLERVLNDSQTTYLDIHNATEKITSKTKAIIFDLGNVVVPCRMQDFMRSFHHLFHLGKPKWENVESLISQKKLELIRRYEKGMPSEVFFHEMGKLINIPFGKDVVRGIESIEYSFFQPIDKRMYDLLNNLSRDYSLAVLSNIISPHKEYVLKRYHIQEIFDYFFFSCDLGMRKPEPEFYEHAVRNMGIKPEEAVFVDDCKTNVEGGMKYGIPSLLFTSVDKLAADFSSMNIIK